MNVRSSSIGWIALFATACHSSSTTRPTIEDVRPGGYVCFPRSQPDARGRPNGSDATPTPAAPATVPTTIPTTQASAAHGAPGHWCALCAAAAARAAEQGREHATLITPESDLMSDLPPR